MALVMGTQSQMAHSSANPKFRLVLLKSPARLAEASQELDWEEMDKVVAVSRVQELYRQDDEDEGCWSDHNSLGLVDHVEAPPWLKPLLRRWKDLQTLQTIALKFGPSFPMLDPLAIEELFKTI